MVALFVNHLHGAGVVGSSSVEERLVVGAIAVVVTATLGVLLAETDHLVVSVLVVVIVVIVVATVVVVSIDRPEPEPSTECQAQDCTTGHIWSQPQRRPSTG